MIRNEDKRAILNRIILEIEGIRYSAEVQARVLRKVGADKTEYEGLDKRLVQLEKQLDAYGEELKGLSDESDRVS